MSRLLDVLLAGGEVALRYDDDHGIIASALLCDGDGPIAEGDGRADIDAALDALEPKLSPHRAKIEQRIRKLGRASR